MYQYTNRNVITLIYLHLTINVYCTHIIYLITNHRDSGSYASRSRRGLKGKIAHSSFYRDPIQLLCWTKTSEIISGDTLHVNCYYCSLLTIISLTCCKICNSCSEISHNLVGSNWDRDDLRNSKLGIELR